jgi:MoaA/NifB/PqqE/SkfB family radical SAM enzyme
MNHVQYGLAKYILSSARRPERVLNHLGRPKFMLNRLLGLMGFGYRFADLARIALFVTTTCNMRCAMCDIGQKNKRGADRVRASQADAFLSLDLLNRLLDDPYVRRRRLFFDLHMAEPLLHPDICEMVKLIKEAGHTARMTTNGYLLPEKAAGLIEAGLAYIQVSIDGPEEVHDSIRGVDGAYRNAIDGIRMLNQAANLRTDVSCTVSCLNDSAILDLFHQIGDEGIRIDVLKFRLQGFISGEMMAKHNESCDIKTAGRSASDIADPSRTNTAEVHRQLDAVRSMKSTYKNITNLTMLPDLRSQKQIGQYFDVSGDRIKGNSKCAWPWERLALTTDGRVLVHPLCFDFSYGDFNQSGIGEIFHNDMISSFRRGLRDTDYCYPACTRCCAVMMHGLLF